MTGMLARLGNVLYWLCTGVAVLSVLGGVFLALDGPSLWSDKQQLSGGILELGEPVPQRDKTGDGVFLAGVGVVVWLVGRTARYILAGK